MQAKKHYSQNFLHDERIINHIIQVMAIQKDEQFLEIGPGTGALTKKIAQQCQKLTALEIDKDLISVLNKRLQSQNNITIKHADALTFAYDQHPPFRLISNLPYHLSTALIRKFISQRDNIIDMHLMMQKEVAQRLLCTHGKARGWLSVIIELLCDAELLFEVAAESFDPVPNVQSAVVRFLWKKEQNYESDWLCSFEKIVMQAFTQKRKTLYNNFLNSAWKLQKSDWQKLNIDCSLRAEQLPLEDYLKLYTYLKNV